MRSVNLPLANFLFCFCLFGSLQNTFAQGSLVVEISGLPHYDAGVIISGPAGYSITLKGTDTLKNLTKGKYGAQTQIKTYLTRPFNQNFRTEKFLYEVEVGDKQETLQIQFREMPASKAIYIGNQNAPTGKKIIAFKMDHIRNSGSAGADVSLTGSVTSPRSMAFDKNGNLWAVDGAGLIKMYSWFELGSGNVKPAKTMKASNPHGITFDSSGNLWCSTSNSVMMYPTNEQGEIATTPKINITSSEFKGVRGLSFDPFGNLWLANSGNDNLLMIKKENLSATGQLTPDRKITVNSLPPVKMTLSSPISVTVDIKGNLFVGFYGPNVIAKIAEAEWRNADNIMPKVQVTLNHSVLLDQMVIDNDNSLWVQLGAGKFGKIDEDQLGSAGKKDPKIIIQSADLKYGSGMASYNPNVFK